MLITADQIVCHMVGDYLLQSDWMAGEKTKRWIPAIAHVVTYSIPFMAMLLIEKVALSHMWKPVLVIAITHLVIDHYRLARYVVWFKNFLAPKSVPNPPWSECVATGYPKDRPIWLTTWLLIIADNIIHVVINALALMYLK
jgi:hypothetical protein